MDKDTVIKRAKVALTNLTVAKRRQSEAMQKLQAEIILVYKGLEAFITGENWKIYRKILDITNTTLYLPGLLKTGIEINITLEGNIVKKVGHGKLEDIALPQALQALYCDDKNQMTPQVYWSAIHASLLEQVDSMTSMVEKMTTRYDEETERLTSSES